jgi:cell division protein FtsI/penicillin-binding protein 2
MGSLVKPFTAIAYGEQHEFRYPEYVCRGTASGCWRPRGHGQINLTDAVAYSCNAYFETLSAHLTGKDVGSTAARFDIEPPQAFATGPALVGIGQQWLISPLRMSRAYLELLRRREQRGIHEIVEGMALSGRRGTGAAVDQALTYGGALVKTGTAPCSHAERAPGDGFAIALWPADQPRLLVLVRVHGVPGAQAAKSAGEILSRIGE